MRRIALFTLLFVSGTAMCQTLNRKAVFSKDQQLEKKADMKISFGMEMMGQTIEVVSENNITSLLAVKSVSDKGYDISSIIKHVVSNTGAMGQNMSYDSDKPGTEDNEVAKVMKKMVGKTTNFSVDKKGYITASDDTTSAGDGMGQLPGMGGSMLNGLSAAQGKVGATFELVAPVPDKALKAGDTWSDSTVDKDSRQVSNYKVVSIANNIATVALDGTISRKGETEAEGMTVNMDMKGKMAGEMLVDVTTGIVKKRSMELTGNGNMEIMGQSVPFTMKMTMGENVNPK